MEKLRMSPYKYIQYLFVLVIAGSLFFLGSCKKSSNIGTPVIKDVRVMDPAKSDSFFTQSNPGKLVVIQGENFDDLKAVYINNASVYVISTFVTSTNIVVTIPANIPNVVSDPSVPNTIRVVTSHGEASYNFKIVLGAPSITSIQNENPVPGDTLVIYGTNLFAFDSIVFPGNIKVTDPNIFTNTIGLVARVLVPQNLSQIGPIRISGQFGNTVSFVNLNDTANMYCNFDNKGSLSWGCSVITDNGSFPGAHGKFANLKFTNVGTGDWSWWNGGRSINLNAGLIINPANMTDPIGNYAVKFDLYAATPWSSGELFILPQGSWTYLNRFCPWKVNNKRTALKSLRWQTYTIPLTSFLTKVNGLDGTGIPAATLGDLFKTGNTNINFLFINSSVDEKNTDINSQAIASFSAGIDNIKVVKIK